MNSVALSKLADLCNAEMIGEDFAVQSVSTDTRSLKPGDLFIALQGENFDARQFVKQAEDAGAVAAVVPELVDDVVLTQLIVEDTLYALGVISEWHRAQFSLPIVGLTGSVGKTSCKELLASIFSQSGLVHATSGNLNNEIGVPLTLLGLREQHDFAVIEMGAAKKGDIAYLGQFVHANVALITTVAAAHLEGFGSMQNIADTKGEIYQSLSENGTAVVNLDNEYTRAMLPALNDKHIVSFSTLDPAATVSAQTIRAQKSVSGEPLCYAFDLVMPGSSTEIVLSVPGEFMVHNALAAAACAYAVGVEVNSVKKGLEQFSGFKQRMVTQQGVANSVVIDDSYNANPASMRSAIDVLASMDGFRVLAMGVMAELGPDSKELHADIGRYARDQGIDMLLAVGDEPALAAASFGDDAAACSDHAACIELCRAIAKDYECSVERVTFLAKGSRSAKMEKVVAGLSLLEGAS